MGKHIGALPEATQITQADLLVMEQNSVAKKVTGKTLMDCLAAMLDGHGGIKSITKVNTDGLVDTYRLVFSDDSEFDYDITNGRGIVGIEKIGVSGNTDTYMITYSDKTTSTFTIMNGTPGAAGRSAYVWIRYASQKPTAENPSIGTLPDDWMGIYSGQLPSAPADWSAYTWFYVAGKRGLSFYRLNASYVGSVERYSFSDFSLPEGYTPMVGDAVLMNNGVIGYVYEVFADSEQADVTSTGESLRGPTGATPQLSVGNVSSLDAGNDPYVTITGTAENPKLNFGIPKGEGSLFVFTVTQNEDGSYSADKTRAEVLTAYASNMAVYCDLVIPGTLVDTPVRIPLVSRTPVVNSLLFEGTYENSVYQVRYYYQDATEPYDENAIFVKKIENTGGGSIDIPTTLPNPYKLHFTGAVTGSYDGSEEVTVNIPIGAGTTVYKTVDFDWVSESEYAKQSVDGSGKIEIASVSHTGYGYAIIPVSAGDVYRIYGQHYWESLCYAITDADGLILKKDAGSDSTETAIEDEITIPTGAKYLYVNKFGFTSLSKKTVVATNTASLLANKKIIYDGDSICESRLSGTAKNGGAYAKIIADITGGTYDNQAVGGARLVTLLDGYSYHSIVDNLPNLPADGDLYCFDGGVNDYWTEEVQLGEFDYTNFDGELDTTTVCGALETIFRYCLNNFVGKPVCFVIVHKCQRVAYSPDAYGKTFKDYRDAMVGICEKYSIPYYDAFSESGLNGWNEAQNNAFLTAGSSGTPDGCHPNEEGYKRYYVPQLISLFEKIMPREANDRQPGDDTVEINNVLDDVGYVEGYRISASSGAETVNSGTDLTGYIQTGSSAIVYLKNVVMPDETTGYVCFVGFYDANKNYNQGYYMNSSQSASKPTYDSDGNLTSFYFNHEGTEYIRICAQNIDDTSIITVNQPIE